MTLVILTGMLAGAGIALVLRGAFAPAPKLSRLADGSYRTTAAAVRNARNPAEMLRARLLAALPEDQFLAGDLEPDLRILRKTRDGHVIEKFSFGAFGFLLPPLAWVVAAIMGVHFPVVFAFVAGIPLGVGAFLFPDLAVRDQANERRVEFLTAFASYLDLCRILLGAADGPESALEKAADKGDGWPFQEIRGALLLARGDASVKHWDALGQLGAEIDVRELREFAAAMSMTATSSSQPATLAARAASLRDQVLKDIEGDAETKTERMDVPLTMLTMAFTIFLMYAALNQGGGKYTPIDGNQDEQYVTVLRDDGLPDRRGTAGNGSPRVSPAQRFGNDPSSGGADAP